MSDQIPPTYEGQDITRLKGEHAWLSNFYPCKVTYEGEIYSSVEAAYQAAKCVNPVERLTIQRAPNAAAAKWVGKSVHLRPDWELVKVGIMLDLLRQKFVSPELRAKLLATGDSAIEERNDWGDTEWGIVNGKGKNMLGLLLMEIRREIKHVR